MRQPKNNASPSPKQKSLSIHIATDYVGPHGMPLVYGSTPERPGTIKGTVKFASNYDCKGRDIVILYEAKAEAHWTENKKIVNHHTEEIFGHSIWHFPLEHTKPNGWTVVAGVYEKEFEVPLIHPSAFNRSSASNVSADIASVASVTAAVGSKTLPAGPITLLPSSSYSPNAKMKYTIRAILRRPFPSITNVEASQEVWVLHSSLPPPPPPPPLISRSLSPKSTFATAHQNSKLQRGSSNSRRTDSSTSTYKSTLHDAPSPPTPPAGADNTPSNAASSSSEQQQKSSSSPSSTPRSLLSLSMPTKAIKSALSMLPLPSIDLSRAKQLALSASSAAPVEDGKTPGIEQLMEPQQEMKYSPSSSSSSSGAAALTVSSRQTSQSHHLTPSSPSTISVSSHSATANSDDYTSEDTLPSSDSDDDEKDQGSNDYGDDDEKENADEQSADYTGVWEHFQMPYSCAMPSETVYLGQVFPLTIRFGRPRRGRGERHGKRKKDDQRKDSTSRNKNKKKHGKDIMDDNKKQDRRNNGNGYHYSKRRSEKSSKVTRSHHGEGSVDDDSQQRQSNHPLTPSHPASRFVIKKGIVKVVEHTLLREVTVTPAPPELISHHNQVITVASSPMMRMTNGHNDLRPGTEKSFDHRDRLHAFQQQQQYPHQQETPSGHIHTNTIGSSGDGGGAGASAGSGPMILPGLAAKDSLGKGSIYQGHGYNGSHSHLYELLNKESKQTQQQQDRRRDSGELKRLFFKPKRHSLDHVPDHHRSAAPSEPMSSPLPTRPTNSQGANANAGGSSVPLSHGLPPLPPLPPTPTAAIPLNNNTKIVSSIEAKFKTEVVTISLTPVLQQRERQYQRLMARRQKGDKYGHHDGDDDGEEKEAGVEEQEEQVEDDNDAEGDLEDGVWQTTVLIQLPGPSELATYTETKHIVKTHTLQLILLCGLVADISNKGESVSASAPSASVPVFKRPGINKEFRLEMDLHVTGPRAPVVTSKA
ncbi:hypothetical protein BGX28_000986 [Mortierella sp. GBA30]|nr:hypothetical protein BGX28_000986 [Mortierella sp. GBA30]